MAFQTSVLRDGEWVTETVNLQAALKASAAPKASNVAPSNSPTCGILSRTVVESPIVRWILPVRLRAYANNDIAFIGSNFVQIRELQKTGQLHDVLKKTDFDLRIRNALVFGRGLDHSLDEDGPDMEDGAGRPTLLLRDTRGTRRIGNYNRQPPLPPQLLVLVLESGDFLFVFIVPDEYGRPKFVTMRHEGLQGLRFLGHHMAVDPHSRYMAAVSPDGLLVVYELESMEVLASQYKSNGQITPIKSTRIRAIQGVIQKAEFLYPRPSDDYHIILLLFIARKERGHSTPVSRMVIHEWELGDDLDDVFSEEKPGTRLPPEHKMPLLLIPIRSKTSFLIVSQHHIGIVKEALSGLPSFEYLPTESPSPTKYYHGQGEPLWTAWARTFRLREYCQKTDVIYLAREDGAIQHIEIDIFDLVPSLTNVGFLDTNIDTAFAASFDRFSDVLIVAGDSGPGGVWRLAPRTDEERVSVLPNWSPVVDMTASRESLSWNQGIPPDQIARLGIDAPAGFMTQKDTMYSASGRGLQGTVTEWRWGIRARIGLDLDVGEPTRQAWAFFMDSSEGTTLGMLLAVPHSSTVLAFSEDLDQVDALSAENTPFDLSSTTLAATQTSDDKIIQVTENYFTLVLGTESSQESIDTVLGTHGATVQKAFCFEDSIVVSCQNGSSSQIHTLAVDTMHVSKLSSWEVQGEVTCLSIFAAIGRNLVAVCSRHEGTSKVSFFVAEGDIVGEVSVDTGMNHSAPASEASSSGTQIDALTSICLVQEGDDEVTLAIGTRCGHLVTMRVLGQGSNDITWNVERLGVAPVDVFPALDHLTDSPTAFACCDNNFIMLGEFSSREPKFKSKILIWPTDFNDASMPSLPIHSLYRLHQNLLKDEEQMSLLLLSGSRILLAELWPDTDAVPRSIPVGGTPTRVIFSQTYQCLIVALLVDNRPTLAFVDPQSGKIISEVIDKDRNPTDFASGLGQAGDRITGLKEWIYVKDGNTFPFTLATTKSGCLLIISANMTETQTDEGVTKRIEYWTRNRKRYPQPIYSIAADGDGIVFCVDSELHWEVLDLVEKKLKPMKSFQLGSPATSLQVMDGKTYALTTTHSLLVIDHRSEASNNEMALLHTDRISRSTMHMIDMGASTEPAGAWPIFMLSDLAGGIAGVWVPWGQRNKEFTVVFEGALPTAVRRFIRIQSHPLRQAAERGRRYGTIASSVDNAETFGVSVSGSLYHFTLLSVELWQFIYLLQTLAQRNPDNYPLTGPRMESPPGAEVAGAEPMPDSLPDIRPHPSRMHIHGELVRRCLTKRKLESIVDTRPLFDLYCRCLDKLENGIYTERFRGSSEDAEEQKGNYFSLGYDVLEYLFAPIL